MTGVGRSDCREPIFDARCERLVESLPVPLIAFDDSGLALWWNEEAERLLSVGPRTTIDTLKATVNGQPGRFRLRPSDNIASDDRLITWVVVAEHAIDNDLVEVFAHQALHDALTDLPNRSLLDDRIRQGVERSARNSEYVAVAFLDLDHFKLVNDTQGHADGDAVLRAVAERLTASVRPGDTVARFGGDEFVVVCEGVEDEDSATELAERLRKSLEIPFSLHGEDLYVSASVGVAVGRAQVSPQDLLRDADAAMYHAKGTGRARTELFDDAIRARAEYRHRTEKALHRALAEDRFHLLYQPIVSLDAGWVVGAEALLRWNDPDLGLLVPGDFISVAEETGLILPLGEWVLDEACRQLRRWRVDVPHVPLFMSVNLSARQLNSYIARTVAEAAARYQVDPSALMLEITEGVLMTDARRCSEQLHRLKDIGVQIAIDDFGMGYSSLGYLKRFPVDVVKIDQAFINGLATDSNDAAIVSAIAGIARSLRLSVVAEGVETPEQLYAVRHLTCELAQGYRFAPPLPPDEFSALVRAGPRW